MGSSQPTERARDLPATIGHMTGAVLFGLVLGLFGTSVATLPAIIPLLVAETGQIPVLQVYFGLYLALSLVGTSNFLEQQYEETGDFSLDDFDEVQFSWLIAILMLMLLYVNILFVGTLLLTTTTPEWAWYLALVAPVADRTLVSVTGYSPAIIPVIVGAYLLEWSFVSSEIDLDAVKTLNPAVAIRSPTRAA